MYLHLSLAWYLVRTGAAQAHGWRGEGATKTRKMWRIGVQNLGEPRHGNRRGGDGKGDGHRKISAGDAVGVAQAQHKEDWVRVRVGWG